MKPFFIQLIGFKDWKQKIEMKLEVDMSDLQVKEKFPMVVRFAKNSFVTDHSCQL